MDINNKVRQSQDVETSLGRVQSRSFFLLLLLLIFYTPVHMLMSCVKWISFSYVSLYWCLVQSWAMRGGCYNHPSHCATIKCDGVKIVFFCARIYLIIIIVSIVFYCGSLLLVTLVLYCVSGEGRGVVWWLKRRREDKVESGNLNN